MTDDLTNRLDEIYLGVIGGCVAAIALLTIWLATRY